MAETEGELLSTLEERNIEHALLKARKVFLWSPVDDESAKAVVKTLTVVQRNGGLTASIPMRATRGAEHVQQLAVGGKPQFDRW